MGEEPNKVKKKLSTVQILMIVGIGILLVAVVVMAVFLLKKDSEPLDEAAQFGEGSVVVDEGFDPDAARAKAGDNMFEVKMNTTWNFPDGASKSTDAYVANSTANHTPFYFQITDSASQEIIYTSPKLNIGSAVREFKLTQDLDAGSYDCVCMYHLLDANDVVTDTVRVTVKVNVLS